MKIWLVVFDNEYGTDHHAFFKYADAYDATMEYLETWFEPEDYDGPGIFPANYTEFVDGDTVVIRETEVK